MELKKLNDNVYYIENKTNIGIIKVSEDEVYLVDSGNDKDTGRKVLQILERNNWRVLGIINTHSHADHIGGNEIIQKRCNAKIYTSMIEQTWVNNPILEPAFLYGAYPINLFQNKFLMAKKSEALDIANIDLDIEVINLDGHCYQMIGLITNNICFLGDALASEDTINKYHIFYLYDVEGYLRTLDYLETLKADYFLLTHEKPLKDISGLIVLNRNKIAEIIMVIMDICKEKETLETIVSKVASHYEIVLEGTQYLLVTATIKAYLAYLCNQDKLRVLWEDNKMFFEKN